MNDQEHLRQKITLILLASGESQRFSQNNLPKKQWLRIAQNPLWKHLVDVFTQIGFQKIWVTCCKDEVNYARNFFPQVIEGGDSRTQSICNALQKVESEYVLIHDVARFYPQKQVIEDLLKEILKNPSISCVAPRIKIADTLYYQEGTYPNREDYFAIQTPQLSKTKDLKSALLQGEFNDESSAMQAYGKKVSFVEGSPLLHKLTYSEDLFYLQAYAPDFVSDTRTGSGIDIHGFEEHKTMVLCGVEIQSPVGFKAHSDGDVALHSIIDAILGAIGAGDIGEWFPDNDTTFHHADSKVLLQNIVSFARNVGYVLDYIDLTILAQEPKLLPYKEKMKQVLVQICKIQPHRINLKATTGENIGFIGRKEGICVLSQVGMKLIDWRKSNGCFNY